MKVNLRKLSLVSVLKVIQSTTGDWEAHIAPIQDKHSIPERLMELFLITCCWGGESRSQVNITYKWSTTDCSLQFWDGNFVLFLNQNRYSNRDRPGWKRWMSHSFRPEKFSRDKRGFSVSEPSQPQHLCLHFQKRDVSTKVQVRINALFLSSEKGRISDTVL